MKYRVTNRGQPRGFIGKTMTLVPGDNVVDRETVRVMLERSHRFQDHRNSNQVSVFAGPTRDQNRVRLEPVTDIGEQREPETYRARKYEFDADETKELSENEVNELRTDARFMALSGEVLIQGVPEEGDVKPSSASKPSSSSQTKTSSTQSSKPISTKTQKKTEGSE